MGVKRKNAAMIWLFLTPAILVYCMVFLYPSLRTAVMSLFDVQNVTDAVRGWEFVGLANYRYLLQSPLFVRAMRNMVSIWFFGGIGVFALALLFAVMLTSGVRGKRFYRAVIFLPNVISAVAMGTMWLHYVYNSRYGLLKTFFSALGLQKLAALQWTAPSMIFVSLLIAYCFGMVGYYMLIFMAAIERIPADLYEAATLEGAGIVKKFWGITAPLITEVMRTNVVLWTIATVSFFVWSQVFSSLFPEPGTVMPMVYMYQQVFGNNTVEIDRNVGAGAAVGVVLTLVVIAMFFATTKILRRDRIEY